MKQYFTEEDEKLKWNTLEKKSLLSTVIFEVTSQTNQAYDKTTGDYIVLDAKDWVIVIPEFDDKFFMVKQYRHGAKKLSIEFPGGVIEKGEPSDKAALRELKEETGCIPGKLIKIGCCNPNPAFFSNHLHVYLAQELQFTGRQELDKDEFINCMEMNKQEVLDNIGKEDFCHALMATAMMYYLQYKQTKI